MQKKRSPSAKIRIYLRIRRLPDSPPLRASNKKQFEQQQQQQQQQLQQLWLNVVCFCSMLIFLLNVDFSFKNGPVLDETCKKMCCSLLESRVS